jgi:class 3 adenylate cyclase
MPESDENLRLQIGHVLFIEIVGYSKLMIDEQKERLRQLTELVLATAQVARSTNEQLVRLLTGDGMALVFRDNSEEPARCAVEIAAAKESFDRVSRSLEAKSLARSLPADTAKRSRFL